MNPLNKHEKREIRREYLRILIPTIVSMVSHSLYCLADTFFIGLGVGENGLAALSVALPIYTIYTTFSLMIGVGAATTMSIFKGQGNSSASDKVFTQSFFLALIIGLLFSVFGTMNLRSIAYLFGATDLIVDKVVEYLLPVSTMSVVYIMSSSLGVIIRADGNPKLVMAAGLAGDVTNIVLDYVFVMIFGWGMFGAGLATIIGPTLALIILSFHFLLKKNQVRFTKKFLSFPYLLRTIRNGVGSGLMELSAGVVILAFNIMLMKISGETAVAVFSILSNIGYVSKGIFNGIAQAAQPIISENYGAKRYKPMMYVNRIALVTAGIFSAATLALILIFPEQIILFFVKRTDAILAMGIPALILYFTSLPFTGINIVLMYYFQSIERIKYTSVQSVLRGIVLVILALCLFAYLWGLTGVWLALLAAEAITLLIFYPVKIKLDRGYKQKELSDELH